jgi:hypothetical protein
MIRLLDLALLTFLVWFVWSQVIRGWRQAGTGARGAAAPPRQPAAPRDGAAALTLVRCDACGVHVPSGRILTGGSGRVFCSEACRNRAEPLPR